MDQFERMRYRQSQSEPAFPPGVARFRAQLTMADTPCSRIVRTLRFCTTVGIASRGARFRLPMPLHHWAIGWRRNQRGRLADGESGLANTAVTKPSAGQHFKITIHSGAPPLWPKQRVPLKGLIPEPIAVEACRRLNFAGGRQFGVLRVQRIVCSASAKFRRSSTIE